MASGNNGEVASLGETEKLNQDSGTTGASGGKGIDQAAGGDTKKDESAEPRNIPADQRSADYQKLIQCGLDEKVAAKLDDIYSTGKNLTFNYSFKCVLSTYPAPCIYEPVGSMALFMSKVGK